jgi:hypothetical protein
MTKPKSQVEKFRDAARTARADDSEEHSNATLKKLTKQSRGLPKAERDSQKPTQTNTDHK